MPKPITRNTLYYGDNLPILREHIPDEIGGLDLSRPAVQFQPFV